MHRCVSSLLFGALTVLLSATTAAQTLITGDITGSVTDPSGAIIPGARLTLQSIDSGTGQAGTTDEAGSYRFSLLKPGGYSVTVSQTGFQTKRVETDVAVGQVSQVNVNLMLGRAVQTIEVTESPASLNPEPSTTTLFSPAEIQTLPSAGTDITNIAFTAPGVVVNVNNSMGNFSVNGLPGTSNLFTINGENYMDPYYNVNQTGATNLSLGQNELQEATVITNPYAGQYGTFSGAQVNYVTKSGSNEIHGKAQYWWNGRFLNANNWLNNFYGESRPFSNANQWAGSFGGPIRKNSTFFFVDTEGLRFVLPNAFSVTAPTPAFSSAVLNNIQLVQTSEYPAYKTMLNLWDSAPDISNAVPIANPSSCNTVALPGYNPATTPCAEKFISMRSALASEWILALRIDQRFGDRDNAFFRYRMDHGTQPSYLDPINPAFDAISSQPQWDSQFQETHIFAAQATNSLIAAASHYVAQFRQNQLAANTFPYGISDSGSVPFTTTNIYNNPGFNPIYVFPQGRNITQYQFIDDFTVMHGAHALKFGINFRRYDVSDHGFYYNYPRVYFGSTNDGLQKFVNGLAYQYRRSSNFATDVPIATWGLGFYANDEWRLTPNFKLTVALRSERNSNPVCQFDCFANFAGQWSALASVTNPNPVSVPYSSDIAYHQHQAFPGVDALDLSPRIGLSWSPGKSASTVISGGYGVFYDPFPTGVVDDLLGNPPVSVNFRVRPAAGVAPFTPSGAPTIFASSAQAFNITENYSQIVSALDQIGVPFAPPSFTAVSGTFHAVMVQEWNLQVQRQLTSSMSIIANYAANHSSRIPYSNSWENAYDEYGLYAGVAGISATPPAPNYGLVTTIQSGAMANYDGISITLRKQFSRSTAAHFNYTWSHALDETSNGGIYGFNGDSIQTQINPGNLRANNYGNADYDIRHNFSADFVFASTVKTQNRWLNKVLGGWQWTGKMFWRSGLPFSVVDDSTALGNSTVTPLGTYAFGEGPLQTNCGGGSTMTPCLNSRVFVNAGSATFTGFSSLSSQTRNQFRGPGYFDTDMSLSRNFQIKERMKLAFGLQAYNVFNHPNFGLPDNGLGDATFGLISRMATAPTSPYGAFLGFDSSPRIVQITGKFVF